MGTPLSGLVCLRESKFFSTRHPKNISLISFAQSHMNRKYGAISLDIEPSTYSFAIEGKTWATIYSQDPELLKKLVVRGAIFARMNPDQKRQLVMELQSLGYYVGK